MQKPLKKIYFTIGALAVLLAAGVTLWLYRAMLPYEIQEITSATADLGGLINYYKDLDNDGYSERFVFCSNTNKKQHYIKIYRMFSLNKSAIFDQYNFLHPIYINEIFYHDLTGDGMQEVFVFSHDDQALYLSVIDLAQNKYLYHERYILPAPDPNPYISWDTEICGAAFSDVNSDDHAEIVFTVHSGLSKSPRGVFIYDAFHGKMLNKRLFNAGTPRIFAFDLTGDGTDEFIISTTATSNLSGQEPFSDDASWLLALDQRLRFVFKPFRIAERFSSILALPFRYHGKNVILANITSKENFKLLLVDQNGRIIKEKTTDRYSQKLIRNSAFPEGAYLIRGPLRKEFLFVDSALTLKTVRVPSVRAFSQLLDFKDLNLDGKPEFLGFCNDGLYIKSEQLTDLAFYPWQQKNVLHWSYFYHGPGKAPYLSVVTQHITYLFHMLPNPYFNYLPLTFFLITAVLFALFFLMHLSINKIRIYISYFLFSLRKSDNAIMLLNHKGNIITFNAKVKKILKLSNPIKTRQHYNIALSERKQIANIIKEAIEQGKPVKKDFSFEEAADSFIGEVTVTPFTSYFHFINAVLVEIKDSTRQVLFERQKNWQRNIRKMVHDIKNPLAGVQLKMQTLYLKLVEHQASLPPDLTDEFEQAYSELKRIRNISKNFLKFSDVDSLQTEKIVLREICVQCLEHFKNFRNEQLNIRVTFSGNLPEFVYWDYRQVEMLMHILMENAIDAMNGRGNLDITISQSSKVLKTELPHIEIKVADTGKGIPQAQQDKIFVPHFSTKKEGSGMGLVFAKSIVQQHGGTIDFSSSVNSGTVFVITLPVHGGKNG